MKTASLFLGALLLCAAAAAQTMPRTHGDMSALPPPGAAPSTPAYEEAMAKMHRAMDVPLAGDADRDFVAGMIPHHQGAIDMAQVELRYGKDPQLRALASDIIAAQQKEIAGMQQWQAAHSK
jgi:uncharacterized protein (DUF305 family)